MRKRNVAVSLGFALVVLPEPVTTVVVAVLICLWYLIQRRRSREARLLDGNLEVVET